MRKRSKRVGQLGIINPNAGGLDIGSREIWAAVPPDREGETVKVFGTFTPDLHRLADWLVACGVDTVAMESTGVYWMAPFEILEARGLNVYLVNARHIKGVPGRKRDYADCQWLQKLHSVGLLSASFRPDAEMCTLRAYLHHRAQLIQHRAPHISHMQKALQQMNSQLPQVLRDIVGETGMAILRAIVAGERAAVKLAQLRDCRCKSSEEPIAKALTGEWKEEHLFALKQSLELFDFYTAQIAACDAVIQQQFAAMKPRWKTAPENWLRCQPRAVGDVKMTHPLRTEPKSSASPGWMWPRWGALACRWLKRFCLRSARICPGGLTPSISPRG
jgi:hypothetical protein